MTSRSSFFNLLKEDFRRRLWTFILASLVFFGTFVIGFTMVLQGWVANYSDWTMTNVEFVDRVSSYVCEFLEFHPWFMLVAIVGAIICGVNGFAYLHSKKQMDFYHSLPVTREKIFAVRFVNGILIYAVPYLIGLLYAFLITAVFGVMTKGVLYAGLMSFVLHLMGYIIMYLVTIIAMMLTGKLVIAFFGIAVLNAYAPAVYGLSMLLQETFYVTSYMGSVDIEDALQITRWLSPFSYYFTMMVKVVETPDVFWLELLSFVILAVLLTAVTLFLYRKRPSEKADTAMSFKVSEPIVRILISIPVGVLAGLLMFAFQYDTNGEGALVWLVLGSALGGFLAHGIIESLYHGDVKKCLSHKVQLVATLVVAAVIPVCFFFDIFGYDSYLPEKKEIAHMSMACNDLRFGGSYYDENGNWVSPQEYALENMEVTEFDAMHELASILVDAACANRQESFFGYGGVYCYDEAAEYRHTDFIIQYTLKNGKVVTRTYEYNYYMLMDLLEQIYNNNQYKEAVHPVFALMQADGLKLLYGECYSPVSPISVRLTGIEPLIKTYMQDVLALSFDELVETAAIGELTVFFKVGGENQYEDATTFLIYPSMTGTLEMLKTYGVHLKGIESTDRVESLSVYYSGSYYDWEIEKGASYSDFYTEVYEEETAAYYEKYNGPIPQTEAYEYKEIVIEITDPAEIAECLDVLVYSNYKNEFGPFPKCESNIRADLWFQVDEGIGEEGLVGWSEMFRFRKNQIPQFVLDRIEAELLKRN